jgi:hypothetical protein
MKPLGRLYHFLEAYLAKLVSPGHLDLLSWIKNEMQIKALTLCSVTLHKLFNSLTFFSVK